MFIGRIVPLQVIQGHNGEYMFKHQSIVEEVPTQSQASSFEVMDVANPQALFNELAHDLAEVNGCIGCSNCSAGCSGYTGCIGCSATFNRDVVAAADLASEQDLVLAVKA